MRNALPGRTWLVPGRVLVLAAAGVVVGAALLPAQQQPTTARGQIKAIDADKGMVTITADGIDRVLTVAERARFADLAGNPAEGGLPTSRSRARTRSAGSSRGSS